MNGFYENLTVDQYVIMPNHIHLVLFVYEDGSPRTTTPTRRNQISLREVAFAVDFLFRSFQGGFCLFNDAVSFEAEDVLVLFKEGAELLLVVAQLFLAI